MKRTHRHQHNAPTVNPIENLKNKLADNSFGIRKFYNFCYSQLSNDSYKLFLKKLNYSEVWDEELKEAEALLDEMIAHERLFFS